MTLVNQATSQFKDLCGEATTIGLGNSDESTLVIDAELESQVRDTIRDSRDLDHELRYGMVIGL